MPHGRGGRRGHSPSRVCRTPCGPAARTMACGPPLAGLTPVEVLQKAARGNPPPPRELWSEVPEALEVACLKAMAKDPDKRYASAGELAQEVQRWQDVQRRQAEDALRRQ